MKAFANLHRLLLGLLLLMLAHAPALAAVEIAFYSRELGGSNFPHAFVRLSGTLDSTGQRVDTALGFTARSISPSVLLGPVDGEVIVEPARMIARSDRKFAMRISDAQYRAVVAVVERWRGRAQPSYDLHRRNCVHFVGEVAAALGLSTDGAEALMKQPRAFLEHVRARNAPRLAAAP